MNDLRHLQIELKRHVMLGSKLATGFVTGTRGTGAVRRLRVYRDGYYLRFNEALAANFPALCALLGDIQFEQMSARYLDAMPSRHFSLRQFGHRLAAWLKRTAPYRSQPLLTDLARLEWLMAQAFDAADAEPVSPTALSTLPPTKWPELRFGFHPSLHVYRSRWNTVAIWQALAQQSEQQRTPPVPMRGASAGRWIIWRQGLQVMFVVQSEAHGRALRAALHGAAFSQVCECAPQLLTDDEKVSWAGQCLANWLQRGWVATIVTDS